MASQIIELARANSNKEVEELIDFNVNQGSLDYKVNLNVQHQDLSWLRVKNLAPQKEMLKPPSKKRKVQRSDFIPRPRDFCKTGRWVKRARMVWTLTLPTLETSLLT